MSLHDGFNHSTEVEVRFHDLDALGHVNNARYLNYLEQARLAYATEVCGWDGTLRTLGLIVANVTIDFKQPIFLGDKLEIATRASRLGNKSFDLEYRFITTRPPASAALAGEAKTTLVTYDYSEGKTVPIFTAWREAMLAHEPALIA
ncbi:MAG: acyl-CoA thioesterase [Chloroflexota bacterium]